MQNPKDFLPNEKFCQWTKYAIIICNQFYNEEYITLGNLPSVKDDLKNAKHTAKMMGIIPQNTFEIKDASFDELDDLIKWLCLRIIA